jgi:hypothetical protein
VFVEPNGPSEKPDFPGLCSRAAFSVFHSGALPAQAERLVKITGWFLEINFLDEVVLADRKRLSRLSPHSPFLADEQGAGDGS